MEGKKCPLMLINRPQGDCLKEHCAWFVPAEGQEEDWAGDCALCLMGARLRNVDDRIEAIRNAMRMI